jgi:hypothetical protein
MISPMHGIAAASLALAVSAAWAYPTIPTSSADTANFGVHKGCGDKNAGHYASCHAFIMQDTSADGHKLGAQAIFQINGNDLFITLSNTSVHSGLYLPSDFLTGLFFNLKEAGGTALSLGLTNAQALARPGAVGTGANAVTGFTSNILDSQGGTLSGTGDFGAAVASRLGGSYNVGGEWQYQSSSGLYSGFDAGLSSTTLGGLFSNANMNGLNIDPNATGCSGATTNLDHCGNTTGSNPFVPHQMGLVGANYASASPDGGGNPLAVQDSVRFKFDLTQVAGLSAAERAALDLSKKGALQVGFQYGSTANVGLYTVPEPGVLALLGLGGLAFGLGRRRLRQPRGKPPGIGST